ncbi:MAG: ABC transporter permease [Bacteroidota bacterium]|nr:ABC transporter permease [Bacteroidota bacterium]MDX5426969.1 ABC transporter permease [Bacteroidota bacterium]
MFSIKRGTHSLTRPVILFAISSVTLGMVLMLVSVATGRGLQERIKDKIIGFNSHIVISRYEVNESFQNQPVLLQQEFYPDISSIDPRFTKIVPFGTKAGILKSTTDFEGAVLKGVNEDYPREFLQSNLEEGRVPKFNGKEASDSILISRSLADLLNVSLGDRIEMYFIREAPKPPRLRFFHIAGVYNSGLEDFDKLYVIGDLRQIQALNNWGNDEVGGFEVTVSDFDQLEPLTDLLRNSISYDLDAENVRQRNEQLFQWIALFDLNIYLIIGVMVAVAIINMISILLILILERTQMIGILKALGSNNASLRKIFLYQGTWLAAKGLLWGNLIGLGFCLIQSWTGWIKLDPTTYYVTEVPIVWDWSWIILLNLGTILTCYLCLLVPSYLVSKITPVKAIRFE